MKRKPVQFRLRNWLKDIGCGRQIAILPHIDVYWTLDEDDQEFVMNIAFVWLMLCFEIWINSSEELI